MGALPARRLDLRALPAPALAHRRGTSRKGPCQFVLLLTCYEQLPHGDFFDGEFSSARRIPFVYLVISSLENRIGRFRLLCFA